MIRRWLEKGKKKNTTHVIIICDTFDYDDYPVYINQNENVKDKMKEYNRDMQKVMEVYKISMDWETQLKQFRSFNY